MACPEGHEFNLPNPSFPRVSGLYDPCVSLLDTPCPVQPPLALSLPCQPLSPSSLCLFSLILRYTSLIKPRSCAPSLLPPARHSRDSQHWRERAKRTCSVHSHLIACCFLYKAVIVRSILSDLRNYTMNMENHSCISHKCVSSMSDQTSTSHTKKKFKTGNKVLGLSKLVNKEMLWF